MHGTRLNKKAIIERPSPNFKDRSVAEPDILIMHYTAMKTAEDAIELLCDPQSQVSAHYVVDEQGQIYRLVAEDKRAWHAGKSYWEGHTDINSRSIGIEIANPGDAVYPPAQMNAVKALSRSIINRYNMRARYIIGHSDIAPSRKQDPGHLFDWSGLSAANVGVWPSPLPQDYKRSANWGESEIRQALTQYGYNPDEDFQTVLTAYQRHFRPEVFATPDMVGKPDAEGNARLACLVRRKQAGIRKLW